ncbi:MAG TPA: YlbF family regulator [Bacillota bacterium]|nr:YlbF family regulator [Bacillota bacterium]
MTYNSRREVLDEAKSLAAKIANTEEVDRFKKLEAKINENKKVQDHIRKIKALQKQAVNLQAYNKTEALAAVEEQLERLQTELDEIPVVAEFKEIQLVVNDVLQMISGTIAREVTKDIVTSTGGDVLTGETGSKIKNKGPNISCS